MYGIKESENGDTNAVVKKTLNERLQEKLTGVDIDRSHWIGKLKKDKQSRPIIIKFPGITLETEYLKTRKSRKTLVLA